MTALYPSLCLCLVQNIIFKLQQDLHLAAGFARYSVRDFVECGNFLVIVVPTRQLKRQWSRAALRAGLTLTACWGNGAAGPPAGVGGVLIIQRFYRNHLGFGQIGATLAQLEHKRDILLRKADELQTAVD